MPYKCSIINCRGNFNDELQCRVFRLPTNAHERQKWISVIPKPNQERPITENFRLCEKHWPDETSFVTVQGGSTRPTEPPSIFDIPKSLLPSKKPTPRKTKIPFATQAYFDNKDRFKSFSDFSPISRLSKKYNDFLVHHGEEQVSFVFLNSGITQCMAIVTVSNNKTDFSPATISAFKNGLEVPIPLGIVNPNKGLNRYSQFMESVNFVLHYDLSPDDTLSTIAVKLNSLQFNEEKGKKVAFISRQMELLSGVKYSMKDYCFAVENYPTCQYDHLRQFLVLPCKRTIRSIISSTDKGYILDGIFSKVSDHQKNCLLIVDEMKIRPTISYSGGYLNGYAENNPSAKASSVLGIMLKCMKKGPSVMLSLTPVHQLTADYQFQLVTETARAVENSGGMVIGSVTDNHKINQKYCTIFNKKSSFEAEHPLDKNRSWFLLFDTVHLLKCIRNNWYSEKTKKLTLDGTTVGNFRDVQQLYEKEKNNILKSTPLTSSAVYPTTLQLQNVKHVVRVFNDRVVAALKLDGKIETARLIQQVLTWWKIVNVAGKSEDIRFNDQDRVVQTPQSNNLSKYAQLFSNATSGHGSKRIQSLTHDTRKALIQTTEGLEAVCRHLYSKGQEYVCLKDLQSDKIEREFGIYRQSVGANFFMTAGDAVSSFKKRLTRFSAVMLQQVERNDPKPEHICQVITYDVANAIESSNVTLTRYNKKSFWIFLLLSLNL